MFVSGRKGCTEEREVKKKEIKKEEEEEVKHMKER